MGGYTRLLLLLAQHALLAALALADNWAVIVSSSRYWHNYRHEANALSVYSAVRRWVPQAAQWSPVNRLAQGPGLTCLGGVAPGAWLTALGVPSDTPVPIRWSTCLPAG